MKRAAAFVIGLLCGLLVGASLRCSSIGRAMYRRGFAAGVAKVQAEAIGRGYATIATLKSWKGQRAKPGEVRREFVWLYPGQIHSDLESKRSE